MSETEKSPAPAKVCATVMCFRCRRTIDRASSKVAQRPNGTPGYVCNVPNLVRTCRPSSVSRIARDETIK